MRSERRHELQHNVLLDWLTETGKSIKPHVNAILLGIMVVLVGIAAYKWMSMQSSSKEASAWNAVYAAMNQGDTAALDQAVEDYRNTAAAEWAAVVAADLQLNAGCQDLFTTKASAANEFEKARDKYTELLKDSRNEAIRERATFGLARTYEAMASTRQSEKVLDLAKTEYKKVVDTWPNGAYADAAQSRLNALGQTSTLEFYDALAAWEPRPAIKSPAGLEGLNIPFDESGKGLDVGEKPKDFFGDIKDKIDGATKTPGQDAPADGAATPAETPQSTDVPAMPAATGDPPADKPEATGDQPAIPEASGEKPAENGDQLAK